VFIAKRGSKSDANLKRVASMDKNASVPGAEKSKTNSFIFSFSISSFGINWSICLLEEIVAPMI
jgi:hypothetical protein